MLISHYSLIEPVDSDLESFPVLQDELVLIMNPDHSLAKSQVGEDQ